MGKHSKSNALRLPPTLRPVLVRVIETDSDIDNSTCAMNCLANIAGMLPSFVLADSDVVACALHVVVEQGTGTPHSFSYSLLPHNRPIDAFFTLVESHAATPPRLLPPFPFDADMTLWRKMREWD